MWRNGLHDALADGYLLVNISIERSEKGGNSGQSAACAFGIVAVSSLL